MLHSEALSPSLGGSSHQQSRFWTTGPAPSKASFFYVASVIQGLSVARPFPWTSSKQPSGDTCLLSRAKPSECIHKTKHYFPVSKLLGPCFELPAVKAWGLTIPAHLAAGLKSGPSSAVSPAFESPRTQTGANLSHLAMPL